MRSRGLIFLLLISGFSHCSVSVPCHAPDASCGLGLILFAKFRVPKSVFVTTNSGTVQSYRISGTDLILVNSITGAGTTPSFGAIDPLDQFLAQTFSGSGTLAIFSINGTTGALTQTASLSIASPNSVAFSPDGRYVYVAGGGGFLIGCYLLNRNDGTLSLIENESIGGSSPNGIIVDPSGRYVIMTDNTGTSRLLHFVRNAGGDITAIGVATNQGGGWNPNNPVFVPGTNGAMLVTPNKNGNNLSSYSLNSSGQTTSLQTSGAISSPVAAEFVGGQNVLYVTNVGTSLSRFRVSTTDGSITSEGSTVIGTQLTTLSVDPTAKYAAAADQTGNLVHFLSVGSDASVSLLHSYAVTAATVVLFTLPPLTNVRSGVFFWLELKLKAATDHLLISKIANVA